MRRAPSTHEPSQRACGGHRRTLAARLALSAVLFGIFWTAGCREEEEGAVVASLRVEGNEAIAGGAIREVMTTRARGRLPWTPREHFSEEEFRIDLERVRDLYNQRGYPDAVIADVTIAPDEDGSSVDVSFAVQEGSPVIVERVDFFGLEPERSFRWMRRRLPVQPGAPRQQSQVAEARDMVLRALQERGRPHASVRALEGPGSSPRSVTITLAAEPGPEAVFGPVTISGNAAVDDEVIREHLAFTPGERFRASRLRESQRRLYGLDLFQFAVVDTPEGGAMDDQSGAVPVTVTVTEAKPRRARFGVGYGSEEKARVQMEWRNANFMGGARTTAVEGKWSSLDRGARVTFADPAVGLRTLQFRTSLAQWWTNEPTYSRSTSGGRVTLSRDFVNDSGWRQAAHTTVSASYVGEYERYSLTERALADPSLRDDLVSLGLDPDTAEGSGTTSALAFDTPIGPVRVDLGFQLTPIEGLVIDGESERRRWRLHFSLGQAF